MVDPVSILIIFVKHEVGPIFVKPKHIRRDHIAQVSEDMRGLIELLLDQVCLCCYDSHSDPLRGAGLNTGITLGQCLLSDALQFAMQFLRLLCNQYSLVVLLLELAFSIWFLNTLLLHCFGSLDPS